jgi:hypothetical protein
LGYAMSDQVCADCTMLQRAALDAIVRHNDAPSRLAIVKLRPDSAKRRGLEPVVEHLLQVRIAAVRAYQEHLDTHTHKLATAEFRPYGRASDP